MPVSLVKPSSVASPSSTSPGQTETGSTMLEVSPVFPVSFQSHVSPQVQAASLTIGLLAVATGVVVVLRRSRPSPEAIEQARRTRLTLTGRITDGSLVDTTTLDGSFLEGASRFQNRPSGPEMLLFRYRIAGVAYEAVQDVTSLTDRVRGLRIDLPIQVRYDHNNPADSIVVAEEWSGLQLRREQTLPEGTQSERVPTD